MRVAIYARYSSNLQSDRSVEDQINICRSHCDREGWTVIETFADYAISGAVRERPGLNAMLAQANQFDIIVSEALDRISRHQADSATIFETLKFNNCKIVTLSEGEISELHIGLKGTMAALFRADLADKIRRGQKGRVASQRIPGGLLYGYRKVHRLDAKGEPELGLREIDDEQADVIRRVVCDYLAGMSPVAIARALNREGVPSPTGKGWRAGTINGDNVRLNGLLCNPMYAGQLIYNRTHMVRDPVTRKRITRINDEREWQIVEVPELRIIDQDSWDAMRLKRGAAKQWNYRLQRRPRHIFSQLIECGECGSHYTIRGGDYWRCGSAQKGGLCTNLRTISTDQLEKRALQGLSATLLEPKWVSLFVKEYHAEANRLRKSVDRERTRLNADLLVIEKKVERLVDAITNGAGAIPEIVEALNKARFERQNLADQLTALTTDNVIAFHPDVAQRYSEAVKDIAGHLRGESSISAEAKQAIRALIHRVIVTPKADATRGVDIEIEGKLANIIAFAQGRPVRDEIAVQMVAEEGLIQNRNSLRAILQSFTPRIKA